MNQLPKLRRSMALAVMSAIASPFLALTPAKRDIRKRNKESEAATIAAAEAKRLRKQQKRIKVMANVA